MPVDSTGYSVGSGVRAVCVGLEEVGHVAPALRGRGAAGAGGHSAGKARVKGAGSGCVRWGVLRSEQGVEQVQEQQAPVLTSMQKLAEQQARGEGGGDAWGGGGGVWGVGGGDVERRGGGDGSEQGGDGVVGRCGDHAVKLGDRPGCHWVCCVCGITCACINVRAWVSARMGVRRVVGSVAWAATVRSCQQCIDVVHPPMRIGAPMSDYCKRASIGSGVVVDTALRHAGSRQICALPSVMAVYISLKPMLVVTRVSGSRCWQLCAYVRNGGSFGMRQGHSYTGCTACNASAPHNMYEDQNIVLVVYTQTNHSRPVDAAVSAVPCIEGYRDSSSVAVDRLLQSVVTVECSGESVNARHGLISAQPCGSNGTARDSVR